MIIDIVKSNFKIIIFGFVFTFFSCIGQSFFIGLFNSSIRAELNIRHGEFDLEAYEQMLEKRTIESRAM